jgi:4-hydroxy-2-oxoheptanedioate aldolase
MSQVTAVQHRYAVARAEGRTALGMICCLDGAAPSHILASAGFDFVLLDRQHAAYTWPELESMAYRVRATGAGVFVRTMGVSPEELNLTIDLPIDGIMLPNIASLAEARDAMSICRFPPTGRRSVGNARTGAILGANYRSMPDPLVGLLIVDIGAVEAIEEIVELPGLDFVFVGPHDLAGTMGLEPNTEPVRPAPVAAAIERVEQAVERAGIPYWIWGNDVAAVERALVGEPAAVMWSIDAEVLRGAAVGFLDHVRSLAVVGGAR